MFYNPLVQIKNDRYKSLLTVAHTVRVLKRSRILGSKGEEFKGRLRKMHNEDLLSLSFASRLSSLGGSD
jgi:hypothetical protein